jgi:hypothetical protein
MKTDRNGIPAAAFMVSFSSAGRGLDGEKVCVHCKANRARWDSIYCSEHCKTQFHAKLTGEPVDHHPKILVVDRWDGQKWIEVRLTWNGTGYTEAA